MASSSPRKVIKAKRVLPPVPPDDRLKSVTFNDEIIETSIGGTQRVGKIKQDVLLHFDTPVTTNGVSCKRTSQTQNGDSATPKSGGKSSTVTGKENKEVSSGKPKTSLDEASSDEATTSRLSVNNNNSSSVRSSPSKSRSSNVSSGKSVKNDTKKSVEKQSGPSVSQIQVSFSTAVSGFKEDTNLDVPKKKKNSEESDSSPSTDSRRTTMERIETVAQSPFRTPNSKQARRHTLESKILETPDCYRDVNFGTPRRLLPMIQDESVDLSDDGEDSCSIMVAVRVRPFGQRELSDSNTRCAVSMNGNETVVTSDNGNIHRFAYDFSFWSHSKNVDFCDQENVYVRLAQPLLGKAFEGYNTCLFAYGQTGSGKSYCIMGHAGEPGIIPRFCEELFARAENLTSRKKVKVNVEISFFEIYNEKIHDLLASSKEKGAKKATLKVREHPVLGPYVEGLSTYVVNSFDDVEGWINLGNKNRATAATGMNDKSSRSHSVFTIVLTQTKTENIEGQEHDHSVNSKINLVDLAGSERQSLANTSGERLREGANINKSLLTLGKVISLLSERSITKKRKIFIPYRDSVLTWLLKESLGGNSKTAMIATISPASQHIEETLSTLRYAQQARSIVNVVRINEDPKAKIIRQLRAEIERLRAEQGGVMNESALAASMTEISRLKAEMEELSRSWQERLRQAEMRKAEELQLLERAGITFKVDNRLPNLVNLNEDPQLSEMLLYVIKEGETKVGRKTDHSRHDIELTGALIADNHCVINSKNGAVKITPTEDAPTYVNGDLISQTAILHHGDRVILGGDHYFRFNHPNEVQKNKSDARGSSEMKDFDFAKQELHQVQEARLQAELEDKLEKTRKELTQQKDGYESKLKGLESVLTKVEQTHKEAQSTIHDLKKQNMMLEQEVLAGRKRQKLESKMSQQTLDEMSLTKSKIVELLEAETKQVAERLEKLKNKRSEMVTPAKLLNTQEGLATANGVVAGSPGSRRDLYKVALLLREANKINQYLNTSLVFSREDVSDEDGGDAVHTQIRVINTKHRMFTLWTVAKFEEKLAQMRDLYQNEDDASADDDEVFNDPEDVWEKDTSVSSPAFVQNGLKNIVGLAKTTPIMSLRKGSVTLYSPRTGQDIEMSMMRACKSLLSSVGNNLTALSFEESVIDKVLATCQRVKDSTTVVLNHDAKKSSNSSVDTSWAKPMLQLVADVHLLASHTTLWSSLYDGLQSAFLRDLLARSTDQVKIIGHQASSLLQGCEGQLTSLMSESGHKLTSAVLSLCQTCGELALATDSQVLRLDQSSTDHNHSQLSPEVSENFLSGCNKFANYTLEGGLAALEKCEQKCTTWEEIEEITPASEEMSKRLNHVLSCIRGLLQKTLHIQGELSLDGSNGGDHQQPAQYFSATYKQLQGVVSNVSSVIDSSTLLVESAEPIIQGTSHDGKRLERCADLIQKSCKRLISASAYSYTSSSICSHSASKQQETGMFTSSLSLNLNLKAPSSLSSISSTSSQSDVSSSLANSSGSTSTIITNNETTNDSNLTDITLLSDSQLGQLDSAAHEVSMAAALFTEYTRKNWINGLDKGNTTPRGRRLLPQSPEKSVVTPAFNAAHLKRLNIKRTIMLASKNGADS